MGHIFQVDLPPIGSKLECWISAISLSCNKPIVSNKPRTDGKTDRRRVIQYSPFLNFVETGDKKMKLAIKSEVAPRAIPFCRPLSTYLYFFHRPLPVLDPMDPAYFIFYFCREPACSLAVPIFTQSEHICYMNLYTQTMASIRYLEIPHILNIFKGSFFYHSALAS